MRSLPNRALLLPFAVLLSACPEPPTSRVRPQLVVDPPAIEFGTVEPGAEVTASLQLDNPGTATLHFSLVEIRSDARDAFSLVEPAPEQLQVGAEWTLKLRYRAPLQEGVDGATLVLQSDASNAPEVTVSLGARSQFPACPPGHLRCGGSCVDVRVSNESCGACDNACTGDTTCSNSQCVCVPKSCEDLGIACGQAPDGCGAMLQCPACATPQVCSALGHCELPRRWGKPILIAGVNTSGDEAHGTMTADRRRICFTSGRPAGLGQADIWCADRSGVQDSFIAAMNPPGLNSTSVDWMADLSADGAEIFFASGRLGGGGGAFDLWRAVRNETTGGFDPPTPVTELNTAGWETGPSLTEDGLTLYFDREGDLYRATRTAVGATFNAPVLVPTVNAPEADQEPAPSDALSLLVFCSNREPPDAGYGKLWMSELTGSSATIPSRADIDYPASANGCGPELLSDGSLLFHTGSAPGPGLVVAPPLP